MRRYLMQFLFYVSLCIVFIACTTQKERKLKHQLDLVREQLAVYQTASSAVKSSLTDQIFNMEAELAALQTKSQELAKQNKDLAAENQHLESNVAAVATLAQDLAIVKEQLTKLTEMDDIEKAIADLEKVLPNYPTMNQTDKNLFWQTLRQLARMPLSFKISIKKRRMLLTVNYCV